MDLLMNHMESELYFSRSTKGKQLIIRKKFSFLNVEGGFFFFKSRLNTCFMHGNYFIFIFRWGWITLKKGKTLIV